MKNLLEKEKNAMKYKEEEAPVVDFKQLWMLFVLNWRWFVASIVIGTIQLGSTVDYAILMTTAYLRGRCEGKDKKTAVREAVNVSTKSILVSAVSFFAATFGVGMYSDIDMISSLCVLMSRGALISMICVIFLLPSLLLIFDGIITRTTKTVNV